MGIKLLSLVLINAERDDPWLASRVLLPSLSNVHVIAEAFGCRIRDVITEIVNQHHYKEGLGLPITRTYRVKTLKIGRLFENNSNALPRSTGPHIKHCVDCSCLLVDRRSIIQRFPENQPP